VSSSKSNYSVGRAWLASILIIVGSVLTPVAVVAHWATAEITDTSRFVQTLAPLSKNPAVQQLIITQVTTAIDEQVDISKTTNSLLDGLGTALNLPDAAKKALGLVSDPIASGVKGLVNDVVTKVVTSDAFDAAWGKTLEITQTQVVALLSGDPNSAVQMSNDGTLTLDLKPVIQSVKQALVDKGVAIASAIPAVNATVTLGKVPELAVARVVYQVGVGVGAWLPWIAAAFLALGVLVANRRPRALITVGTVVALTMLVLGIAFSAGTVVASAVIDPRYAAAVSAVYTALVAYVQTAVWGLGLLGVVFVIVGYTLSASPFAVEKRALLTRGFAMARHAIDPSGATFAGVASVLHKLLLPIRVVVVALFGWLMFLIDPLTPAAVLGYTALALLVLFVVEVLAVQVAPAAPAQPEPVPVAAAPSAPAPRATRAKKTTPSADSTEE
jgi:hypothetical protein